MNISLTDGLAYTYHTFIIYVSNNYPPSLKKPFRTLQFYEDNKLRDVYDLNEYFMDQEGTELKFGAFNSTIYIDIKNNDKVDISAPNNWYGRETVIFTASDENATYYAPLVITVIPVNDEPKISTIPHQRGEVGELWVLDLRPYVFDPDNNPEELIYSLDQTKGFAIIRGSSILFNYESISTEALTVKISDGIDESSNSFVVEFVGVTDEVSETQEESSPFPMYAALIYILILIVSINGGIIAYTYLQYKGKFKIEDLFLIHANGNLISHVGGSSRIYTDNEILSGMLTAIQDFIKDGFSEGTESSSDDWSLDHLKFGDRNIFIERGDYMYMAAVFKGEVGWKLRRELKEAIKEIDGEYSKILSKWTGELDGLDGINAILEKKYEIFAPKDKKQVYDRSEKPTAGEEFDDSMLEEDTVSQLDAV